MKSGGHGQCASLAIGVSADQLIRPALLIRLPKGRKLATGTPGPEVCGPYQARPHLSASLGGFPSSRLIQGNKLNVGFSDREGKSLQERKSLRMCRA